MRRHRNHHRRYFSKFCPKCKRLRKFVKIGHGMGRCLRCGYIVGKPRIPWYYKLRYWLPIYFSLIIFLAYLSTSWKEHYSFSIVYTKYIFYVLSAFLGGFTAYKLFKKFEYKEPRSDLQLWLWRIMSGVFAFISAIILMFGMVFFVSSALAGVGKEIGFGISIFFGFIFIGVFLFSGYLMFKYKIRSGLIIHKGEW